MVSQNPPQGLYGARVMSLHASFRTAHGPGRLRHIQLLPCPQEKRLLLPKGKIVEGPLQGLAGMPTGRRLIESGVGRLHALQPGFVVATVRPPTKPVPPLVAHRLATIPVPNAILQNTVEQRGPLRLAPVRVPLRQGHHGILHEIERVVVVVGRDPGHAKSPAFDVAQKPLQCTAVIQDARLPRTIGASRATGPVEKHRDRPPADAYRRPPRRCPGRWAFLFIRLCIRSPRRSSRLLIRSPR